jgi:YHS domain-containing protein
MRKTMGVMYIVFMLGLVLAGCAKKEEPAAPVAPVEKATPAASVQEQTAQKAQEAVTKVAQEANQVQVTAVAAAQPMAAEQTVCPVMKDQPLNKEIFVEYKGKKVYFCCESCKAAFEKDPEKYIKDLPQFKQ